MADSLVLAALIRRRADLAGEVVMLDRRRREVLAEIEHVEQTMKLFGYGRDPSLITPHVVQVRKFRRGELTRMVLDILRTTNPTPCNRDIAQELMRRKGIIGGNDVVEKIMDSIRTARRRHGR